MPHEPRQITFLGRRRAQALRDRDRQVRTADTLVAAVRELTEPGAAGFTIAHEGKAAAMALVYWWAHDNEIHRRAYAAPLPLADAADLEPITDAGMALRVGSEVDRLRAPRLAAGRADRRRRGRLPGARARARRDLTVRIATWNVNSVPPGCPGCCGGSTGGGRTCSACRRRSSPTTRSPRCRDRSRSRRLESGSTARAGGTAWPSCRVWARGRDVGPEGGPGFPHPEARCVAATCGGIRVACVYVPNGGDRTRPLRLQARLAAGAAPTGGGGPATRPSSAAT